MHINELEYPCVSFWQVEVPFSQCWWMIQRIWWRCQAMSNFDLDVDNCIKVKIITSNVKERTSGCGGVSSDNISYLTGFICNCMFQVKEDWTKWHQPQNQNSLLLLPIGQTIFCRFVNIAEFLLKILINPSSRLRSRREQLQTCDVENASQMISVPAWFPFFLFAYCSIGSYRFL